MRQSRLGSKSHGLVSTLLLYPTDVCVQVSIPPCPLSPSPCNESAPPPQQASLLLSSQVRGSTSSSTATWRATSRACRARPTTRSRGAGRRAAAAPGPRRTSPPVCGTSPRGSPTGTPTSPLVCGEGQRDRRGQQASGSKPPAENKKSLSFAMKYICVQILLVVGLPPTGFVPGLSLDNSRWINAMNHPTPATTL